MLDHDTVALETLPVMCKLPGSSKNHENYLFSGEEVIKPHWTLKGKLDPVPFSNQYPNSSEAEHPATPGQLCGNSPALGTRLLMLEPCPHFTSTGSSAQGAQTPPTRESRTMAAVVVERHWGRVGFLAYLMLFSKLGEDACSKLCSCWRQQGRPPQSCPGC